MLGLSLKALHLLKHGKETFRLVSKVSTKWESFGRRLDVEEDQLDRWREECRKMERCWNKVMKHWLDSGGIAEYCVSWEGLYLLLEDVECAEVATQLQTFLQQLS